MTFSPSATVAEGSVRLAADQIRQLGTSDEVYTWQDGAGDSIEATFADYQERYVCDADYGEAGQVVYTAQGAVDIPGSSPDNIDETFGSIAHRVCYVQSGDGSQHLLSLVFRESDGAFTLIGVLHDQWAT